MFSQQHGYDFNVLPCDEISAYGWLEDQLSECECVNYNRASDVSANNEYTECECDWHFTKWPGCNRVLRRTKELIRVLMYSYGEGRWSSMYTDWAWGIVRHQQRK